MVSPNLLFKFTLAHQSLHGLAEAPFGRDTSLWPVFHDIMASHVDENPISCGEPFPSSSSSMGPSSDIAPFLEDTAVGTQVCHEEQKSAGYTPESEFFFCAICLDAIHAEQIAQIKGCEHAYCVNCILQWALHKEHCWCPQCKQPFTCLLVSKALDGSVRDYLHEESVCLLLRAPWFRGASVEEQHEHQQQYEYCDEDEDEYYYTPTIRIGNRRWGDNGYVRAGRQEARPVRQTQPNNSTASSSRHKGKEVDRTTGMGRRAKRAMKRQAADKISTS